MKEPNSLLSMDSQIDSVYEIRACVVEDFPLKGNKSGQPEYVKMFQISFEAMIHSFFNYFI